MNEEVDSQNKKVSKANELLDQLEQTIGLYRDIVAKNTNERLSKLLQLPDELQCNLYDLEDPFGLRLFNYDSQILQADLRLLKTSIDEALNSGEYEYLNTASIKSKDSNYLSHLTVNIPISLYLADDMKMIGDYIWHLQDSSLKFRWIYEPSQSHLEQTRRQLNCLDLVQRLLATNKAKLNAKEDTELIQDLIKWNDEVSKYYGLNVSRIMLALIPRSGIYVANNWEDYSYQFSELFNHDVKIGLFKTKHYFYGNINGETYYDYLIATGGDISAFKAFINHWQGQLQEIVQTDIEEVSRYQQEFQKLLKATQLAVTEELNHMLATVSDKLGIEPVLSIA